jgi:hypothetical protein
MSDLPPLVGHLKADVHEWDAGMAEVSAAADVAAEATDMLGESYRGARDAALEDAEASHMLRDATLEDASATELLSHLLEVARDHALEDAAANEWLARSMKELRDASVEAAAGTEASTAATEANAAASEAAAAAGVPWMGVLIGIGVAATIALAPWLAFITAGAGAVAMMALGVGGIAALGAGILLFGNRTLAGQQALQGFTTHLAALADWLGKLAQPLMAPFLQLLTYIADGVGHLGVEIIQWLGPQMGAVIRTSMLFVNGLFDALQQLGPVVGRFFEAFLARAPALSGVFDMLLSLGVQTVAGLLTNLLRLSDWFLKMLPAMGPQVGGFFSVLGAGVQVGISAVAAFAEWVEANWPTIISFLRQTGLEIQAGFQFVAPVIGLALLALRQLAPVIQFVRDNAQELKPIFYALGGLGALMAASFLLTIGSLILVAGALVGLFLIGDKVVNWLKVEVPAGIRTAGAAFSSLSTYVQEVIGWFGRLFSSIATFFANIVAAAAAGWAAFAAHPLYWVAFIVTWIVVKLYELYSSFVGWTASMVGRALEWGYRMYSAAVDTATRFVVALGNEWSALPGQVWGWLGAVLPVIVRWGVSAAEEAGRAALQLSQAWNRELDALPGQMWSIGVAIVQGIIGGIRSQAAAGAGALADAISGMVAGAKAAAGISSPSLLFAREIGLPIAQGLALGIRQGAPTAHGALAGLIGDMAAGGASAGPYASGGGLAGGGSYSLTSTITLVLDGEVLGQVIDRRVDQRLGRLLTTT